MTQTISSTEALSAIHEGLAKHGLSDYGTFAVYRDISQTSADGRDWADYAGPLHRKDYTPRHLTTSAHEAAELISAIHDEATMGGYRFGHVEFRPAVSRVRKGVTYISYGKPESGIKIMEIGRRGLYVAV